MTRIRELHSHLTQQIIDFSKNSFALEKDYYLKNIELVLKFDTDPIIKFDKKNQVVFLFKEDTAHLAITSVYDKYHEDKCTFRYIYQRVKPNSIDSRILYHKHPVIVEYLEFEDVIDVVNNWYQLVTIENKYFSHNFDNKTILELKYEEDY